MDIKELRTSTGMSQNEFAVYFDIPVRTVQEWEQGRRQPPPYIANLMKRILENEFWNNRKDKKKMLKFEIREESIEIPYGSRNEIKEGVTLDAEERNPQIVKSFEGKEDALNELAKLHTSVEERGSFLLVTEYYVEENEYDEEGEWVAGGDVWGISEMKIRVVAKPSYEVIKVVDNYKEAEEAIADYDGEAFWTSSELA